MKTQIESEWSFNLQSLFRSDSLKPGMRITVTAFGGLRGLPIRVMVSTGGYLDVNNCTNANEVVQIGDVWEYVRTIRPDSDTIWRLVERPSDEGTEAIDLCGLGVPLVGAAKTISGLGESEIHWREGGYSRPANLSAFQVGDVWKFVRCEGSDYSRTIWRLYSRNSTIVATATIGQSTWGRVKCGNSAASRKEGFNMVGCVYEGVVVQTKRIPAGEGLTDSVEQSSIVFKSDAPFVAKDDSMANATVLASAIAKGVKVDDVTAPVEVKLRKW